MKSTKRKGKLKDSEYLFNPESTITNVCSPWNVSVSHPIFFIYTRMCLCGIHILISAVSFVVFPVGPGGKAPACQSRRSKKTRVQSLGWEDPLEEGMATHSSILAWRIPMDRGAWDCKKLDMTETT